VPRPFSPQNSMMSISVPAAGTPSVYLSSWGSSQKPECMPFARWGLMRAAMIPCVKCRVCSVETWLVRT
jgi:hypothetical protein